MFKLTSTRHTFATPLTYIPTILLAIFASYLTSGNSAAQNYSSLQRPPGQEELPAPQAFQDPANRSPQIEELPDEENMEFLMRGPLHEAFAEVYLADPSPGLVVSKPPPQPIHELPPEFKPEGNNVEWIPGYWAFDEEQQEYIWISGVWRDIPPNRRWIGGYWEESAEGYRWISGFWTGVEQQEISYLPTPPQNIDVGPSVAAPGEDYFYVPGNWVYQQDNYVWRSGGWSHRYENWIWIPSRYVWTPNGCIYRAGYWDYQIDSRGTVFAPVQFRQSIYQQPNFYYTPSYVINTNFNLLVHLFVRPGLCHYYFGDWYADRYRRQYQAWINYPRQSRHYDPLFAYYSSRRATWQNTSLLGWVNNNHRFYANNVSYRPPHTYRAQREFSRQHEIQGQGVSRDGVPGNRGNDFSDFVRNAALGRTLDEQGRDNSNRTGNRDDLRSHGFERLDRDQRDQARKSAEQLSGISTSRKQAERTDSPRNDIRQSSDRNRTQVQSSDRRKMDLPGVARTVNQQPEKQVTGNPPDERDRNSQTRSGNAREGVIRSRSDSQANLRPRSTQSTQNQPRQTFQQNSPIQSSQQHTFRQGSQPPNSKSNAKQPWNAQSRSRSQTNQTGGNQTGRSIQTQSNRSNSRNDQARRQQSTQSGPPATGIRSSSFPGRASGTSSSSSRTSGKSSPAPSASNRSDSNRSAGNGAANRSSRSNGNRNRSSGGKKN